MAKQNGKTNGKRELAPKGGMRIGGKTYAEGSKLPLKYTRIVPEGTPHQDPARNQRLAPPNFGRPVMPHILSFQGLFTTISKCYRDPDEALKHNRQNAIIMPKDCFIMECLEARMRATALLSWRIEPEDESSTEQKQLAEEMTKLFSAPRFPDFMSYRYALMDALWYGRQGVQHKYRLDYSTGKRRVFVKDWEPINGDKLVFRYDDGSGKYDPDQIGIKTIGHYRANDVIAGDRHIEQSTSGMVYFLEPWERSRVAVHRHIREDAAFEDPLSAGSIHGIGIRSRIYWTWFQMIETLAMLMDFVQRSSRGIWIYWYPAGNPQAEEKMTNIALTQTDSNVIVMPRTPGDPALDAYGIDRVEVSAAGVEQLKGMVHGFFGHRIKRYILGQTLSSEPDATGLGSAVADLQGDTLLQIIKFDAGKLQETIGRESLRAMQLLNFPRSQHIYLKFVIDTEADDTAQQLEAVKTVWDMGQKIKSSEVMDLIGFTIPGPKDEFLQNPAMAQQGSRVQRIVGPMGPQEGPELGLGAEKPAPPTPDDDPKALFGPLVSAKRLDYAQVHAPHNMTIAGKEYKGGQFIPNAELAKATPTQKAEIQRHLDVGANPKKEKAKRGELKPARRQDESSTDAKGKAKKRPMLRFADGSQVPEHVPAGKIPAAWKDVRVSENPDDDVWATGVDAKGRTKTVYSDSYEMRQAAIKFARNYNLVKEKDKVAAQIRKALQSEDPATREAAACMWLIEEQATRPGSDKDTKAKVKAYGATTLKGEHVVESLADQFSPPNGEERGFVWRVQPRGADLHAQKSTDSNDDEIPGVFVFKSLNDLAAIDWMNERNLELVKIAAEPADLFTTYDQEGAGLKTGRGAIVARKNFKDTRSLRTWAEKKQADGWKNSGPREVRLQFVGKEGVYHDHLIRNPELANELLRRKKAAGNDGRLFDTTDAKLLKFSKTLDSGRFTPKDFRTLKATTLATEAIRALPKPTNAKELKASMMAVAHQVSHVLGNKPQQALESYINPMVWSAWSLAS